MSRLPMKQRTKSCLRARTAASVISPLISKDERRSGQRTKSNISSPIEADDQP